MSCLKNRRAILLHMTKYVYVLESIAFFVGTISICQKVLAAGLPIAWTRQPISRCPKCSQSYLAEVLEQCNFVSPS